MKQKLFYIISSPLCFGGLSGLGPVLSSSGFGIRFLATLRGGSLSLSVTMSMLFSGSLLEKK